MILVPFFAISTAFGFTKNLLSFPFQAPVFFGVAFQPHVMGETNEPEPAKM